MQARAKQCPPDGDWRIWLLLAGRGFGKTRTGAEWLSYLARHCPDLSLAIVGATFDDARYVMVEGPSGILAASDFYGAPDWAPSKRLLRWSNGTVARLYAAEAPRQLRGPEFHYAWADEIAKWRYPAAWDNLMLALRKGVHPRCLATTTPLPLAWLRQLAEASDTALVTGRSAENAAHLAPPFLAAMTAAYGGTDLARQELDGELLADGHSQLFPRDLLQAVTRPPPDRARLHRIVIGVDPAVGGANETGIIVAGRDEAGLLWVLADHSQHAAPHIWAETVRHLYRRWRAEAVIAEVNQGGDLISAVLQTAQPPLALKTVRAMRDKASRALPIAAAYQRGAVAHGAPLPQLVDQMVAFTPTGRPQQADRLDALVWALSALLRGTQSTSHELFF